MNSVLDGTMSLVSKCTLPSQKKMLRMVGNSIDWKEVGRDDTREDST